MEEIPYRLPLVIGATGHRDLRDEDIAALEREVAAVIKRLRREYLEDDTETPVILLSSLAEGADQLVARVALEQGLRLVAPLPMEADEYRYDFEISENRQAVPEFNRLLAQAVAAPVMPLVEGNTLRNVREESRRALQYREVGVFIVRHCHVLIALWNHDEENTAIGGTTEVVKFKRDGIPLDVAETARASLDAPEIGPVVCVDTPRMKPGKEVDEITARPWGRQIVKRYRGGRLRRSWRHVAGIFISLLGIEHRPIPEPPELRAWETFAVQTEMTRQFNREALNLKREKNSRIQLEQSLEYLFDDPTDRPDGVVARAHAASVVPRWCELYAIADTLALAWQKRFQRDWLVLFLLAAAAIVTFELVTHIIPDLSQLFVLYSIIFLATLIYLWHASRRQHQERYLDYRALAEALRVAVFWKLLGIGTSLQRRKVLSKSTVDLSSGESVADAYPIRQPRELDWIKTSLRAVELLEDAPVLDRPQHRPEQDGYSCARNSWVRGQAAFFSKRGPDHDYRATALEIRSIFFWFLSAIVASTLFVLEKSAHWHHGELSHGVVIFVIGVSAGVAAICAGYAERLALNAQARQYDRMRALFERAEKILPEAVDEATFPRTQALFAELGAEAMKETAGWVEIYRQRPIRPP